MLKYLISLLFVFSINQGVSKENSDDTPPHIGQISAQELFTQAPSFKQNYQDYQPSAKEILAAKTLQGKTLTVLFGTWCHDSEREVPRLIKLLDVANIELAKFSLYAVDYSKQDPAGMHAKFDLKYTPTFILLDDGKELGRIVENPQASLGEDLAALVANKPQGSE